MKRTIAAVILGFLLSGIAWLLYQGVRPGPLEVGAKPAGVMIETLGGLEHLRLDEARETRVVLLLSGCGSCNTQLSQIPLTFDHLNNTQVYFLVVEDSLPADFVQQWPGLLESETARVGRIGTKDVRDKLGEHIVPTTLVFDNEDRLVRRERGVIDLDPPHASVLSR